MATISAQQFFGGNVPPAPTSTVIHTPVSQPSLIDRIKSDFTARGNKVGEAVKRGDNPASLVLQAGGQAAGFLGDAALESVKTITPEPVKRAVSDVADKVATTPVVQELARKYEAFKTLHPEAAANIEATGLLAGLLPVGKAAEIAGEGVAKTAAVGADAAQAAARSGGKALKTAGEKATGLGVTMEVPTRQALQTYQASQPTLFGRVRNLLTGAENTSKAIKPTTEANTAVRLLQPGTEWQLGVHAKRVAGQLWDGTIAPALDTTKSKVDMRGFVDGLRRDIKTGTADLSRRNTLLNALDAFAEDYANVQDVSFAKLQAYKEGWAKFVPERAYKGQPIAGALNEIRNLAAQKARTLIYERLGPNVKQAYIDYGNLKSIEEAGIKSVDALRSKGVTKQVWEAVMDKAVTPVATVAGKILYKTGEGLELIGSRGAKKVRDIIQPR